MPAARSFIREAGRADRHRRPGHQGHSPRADRRRARFRHERQVRRREPGAFWKSSSAGFMFLSTRSRTGLMTHKRPSRSQHLHRFRGSGSGLTGGAGRASRRHCQRSALLLGLRVSPLCRQTCAGRGHLHERRRFPKRGDGACAGRQTRPPRFGAARTATDRGSGGRAFGATLIACTSQEEMRPALHRSRFSLQMCAGVLQQIFTTDGTEIRTLRNNGKNVG